MELAFIEENGVKAVEGRPGEPFMKKVGDANRLVEACWSNGVDAALLHAENLPEGFFDLSSRQAGEILQKLRNYRLRLAVVCPKGSTKTSSRFGEMLAEEQQGRDFGVFETRDAALEWLGR